jgi:regulatory protein
MGNVYRMKKQTPEQAKEKIHQYCAYQERSHLEVRKKLFSYGLYSSEVEEIMSTLIADGFLNEERFAKAFAGGKFRMKKWGRIKIVHALEGKGVSKNCIRIGLKEIDNTSYADTLRELLRAKSGKVNQENIFSIRDKLSGYAMRKGYEPELVWRMLREILPDDHE